MAKQHRAFTQFVRSQPLTLSAGEVVRAAREAGVQPPTPTLRAIKAVRSTRYVFRKAEGTSPRKPAAAAKTGRASPTSPRASDNPHKTLRAIALRIGVDAAYQLLDELDHA